MNQAGILARPAHPSRRSQRPLDHGSGIHKAARLEAAEPLMQTQLQHFHPLEQHLVIVGWPPCAVCLHLARLHAAGPCVARNPTRSFICHLGRTWLLAVVVHQADQHRPRPRERNPRPRPQQPRRLALLRQFRPLQVAHCSRAARPHPLLEARRIPLFIGVRQSNQPGLGKPRLQRQRARLLSRPTGRPNGCLAGCGFQHRFG